MAVVRARTAVKSIAHVQTIANNVVFKFCLAVGLRRFYFVIFVLLFCKFRRWVVDCHETHGIRAKPEPF